MSKINKPAQQATKFVKGNQAAPIKKVESESDELSDVPPPPKKNQQQKPIVGTDNKAKAVVKAPKVDSDEEDEPVKLVQQVKKSSFDATKPTTTNKNVAKPGQKKPVQPDSDEESDDAPTPPKKTVAPVKPAAKPAVQTKVAVKPQQESDEESDDAPPPKKPVVATKPAVGAKPAVQAKAKQAPKPDSDDEESDDAPPPKKPAVATKPAAKPAAKVPAKQESDEDDDSDVPPPPKKQVVPAKTAPVAKPAAKQPAQLPSSDDDESEDIPPPPKQAAKPAQQQKAPAKKIEVENDEDEDEDEDDVPPPPKKPQQQFQQKQQQPQQAQQGQQDHEVFVKGLSFDATEQDIKDFFTECGAINSVNLLKGPNGNSKGIAFVRFATEDAQTAAVEYSGSEHMGRTLAIEKTKPREQRAGQQGGAASGESTTCFIGNLSFYATEDSLYPIFEDCGKIKEVRIAKDQDGKSRGFGYVEFFDNASAQKGLSKTGTDVEGRAIRVDLANSTQRSGGDRGSRGGFGGRGGDRGGRGGFGGFGGRGGDRGGSRGRGGFGGRGRGGNLDANDIAAKKGTIAGFAGKRTAL